MLGAGTRQRQMLTWAVLVLVSGLEAAVSQALPPGGPVEPSPPIPSASVTYILPSAPGPLAGVSYVATTPAPVQPPTITQYTALQTGSRYATAFVTWKTISWPDGCM